jgi:hypothetical protein
MTTNPITPEEWPTAWMRDATLIRFYLDGKEIAVIDGVTGLTWTLLNGEPGDPWIVNESVWPIADRWVFTAAFMRNPNTDDAPTFQSIREEGFYGGDGVGYAALQAELMAKPVSPWDYPGSPILYVMYSEREERLSVCRACEFFNHAESTCTVDDSFIPTKTIDGSQVCPDGRWDQASSWDEATADRKREAAVINIPAIPNADQAEFEAEWEARRGDVR